MALTLLISCDYVRECLVQDGVFSEANFLLRNGLFGAWLNLLCIRQFYSVC